MYIIVTLIKKMRIKKSMNKSKESIYPITEKMIKADPIADFKTILMFQDRMIIVFPINNNVKSIGGLINEKSVIN
ncbi:hypothetical protein [Candidatus Nitrosocosmicus sp. R]